MPHIFNETNLETMQRRNILLSAVLAASALATPAAFAEPVIRLVVPYAPGGPLDVTSRVLAERVRDQLGTVVVDNKAGAGGNIGADIVAKAAPDGLTIGLSATATHAVNPWLYTKMPFDASKDFSAITQMVRVPNVLVMNAQRAKELNINTVADLIDKTGEDMMRVRNMGKKSLDEVQKKLEMMGLSLASEDSGSNN